MQAKLGKSLKKSKKTKKVSKDPPRISQNKNSEKKETKQYVETAAPVQKFKDLAKKIDEQVSSLKKKVELSPAVISKEVQHKSEQKTDLATKTKVGLEESNAEGSGSGSGEIGKNALVILQCYQPRNSRAC